MSDNDNDKAFEAFKHDMTAANFRAAVLEAITAQEEPTDSADPAADEGPQDNEEHEGLQIDSLDTPA